MIVATHHGAAALRCAAPLQIGRHSPFGLTETPLGITWVLQILDGGATTVESNRRTYVQDNYRCRFGIFTGGIPERLLHPALRSHLVSDLGERRNGLRKNPQALPHTILPGQVRIVWFASASLRCLNSRCIHRPDTLTPQPRHWLNIASQAPRKNCGHHRVPLVICLGEICRLGPHPRCAACSIVCYLFGNHLQGH